MTSLAFRLAVCLAALFLCPTLARSEESLAQRVKPFVENETLAGAVMLVANKEKVLAVETVGYADIEAKQPMKPDTTFWIASMTKPITGAALMILVDEGKVSLDDPVEKFLPEFKTMWLPVEQDKDRLVLQRLQKPITVRQIMSHTSGLAFSSPLETPTLDGLMLRDAVRSYTMMPLQYEPGTKYVYSNEGINTGGRIIEVVSGMPYEEFMQKRLFEPLGMKDTTFWLSEEQASRLAKTYKPKDKSSGLVETKTGYLKYPLTSRHDRFPMPGGGLFSTAGDLRFCRMVVRGGELDGHRILSEKAVKEMTSKQTPENLKDGYGVGWTTDGQSFGHGGALATNMTIDSSRDRITIWLVQHQGFPGEGGKAHAVFKHAAESLK